MKNLLNIFILALSVFCILIPSRSLGAKRPSSSIRRTQIHMGSYVSVELPSQFKSLFLNIFDRAKRVDNSLSTYKKNSEISQLNKLGTGNLSPLGLQALKKSLNLNQLTDGLFDITVGRLTREIYGFRRNVEKPPSVSQIEMAQKSVGIKNISINGPLVTLSHGAQLDFGGIGKGLAIDQMASEILKNKVPKAMVSIGGDIRCIGGCKVGIRNPFSSDSNEQIIRLSLGGKQIGLSTSGTYENRVFKKYHHLLDPESGLPKSHFVSVTLLGELDNGTLDGLATALALADKKQVEKVLRRFPNLGTVFITSNKEIILNHEFLKRAKNLTWPLGTADFKIVHMAQKKKI